MKMEQYILPQSLVIDPISHKRLKGELIITFASGVLYEMVYRPLGLNSLWSLIGTVASLHKPFSFEIKENMTQSGTMGGFKDTSFCLFDIGNNYITSYTPLPIDPSGAIQVTIEDNRHETFYWVPDSAMMSFEQIIRVGNSLLLGDHFHFKTVVGQRYSNWENARYTASGSEQLPI